MLNIVESIKGTEIKYWQAMLTNYNMFCDTVLILTMSKFFSNSL